MRCTLQSIQGIYFVLAQGCPVAAGDSLNSPNFAISNYLLTNGTCKHPFLNQNHVIERYQRISLIEALGY